MAQGGIALQPRALPAPRPGLLLRIGRLVADLPTGIALQLTRDGRRRAIQSCCDLPERSPLGVKRGNGAAVFQRKLIISSFHGNTLPWCCTSFENSGNPSFVTTSASRLLDIPSRARTERDVIVKQPSFIARIV